MKKFLSVLMLFFTLVNPVKASYETKQYMGETVFLLLSPILYPISKISDGIRSERIYSENKREINTPEKGVPGKSKSDGYLSSRIYNYEYVIFENLCDEKGYFIERKSYLPDGKLVSELKFDKGIQVEEKIYYPSGQLSEHWKGRGKRNNYMSDVYSHTIYNKLGKITGHMSKGKDITKFYYGDMLTYENYNYNTKKYLYETGAPKNIEELYNITPEEKEKLSEDVKYLKDWEKIYDKPHEKTNHNGEYKIYSPNGNIYADFNFKNGYLNGEQKQYFWNSKQLYSIENYKMGQKVGLNKYFYPNGKLGSIKDFRNSDEVIKKYDIDGKIEYEYKKSKRLEKEYFAGKLIYYRDNQKVETYYYDGKIKFSKVKKIIFGEEEIVNTDWYHDGKVKKEEVKAIKDPTNSNKYMTWTKEYYPNGNIKYEKKDYYQVYEKIEKFYDENGKLIKTKKD